MVKPCCESKNHFAKCVTQVDGRPAKITWKCDHCNKHVISGRFKAAYARVHLAALKGNGLCASLCDSTDDHAEGRRMQFRKLIKKLEQDKKEKERKRKYQLSRFDKRQEEAKLQTKKKKSRLLRQPKMQDFCKINDSIAADFAVAQWVIAHDIAPNALTGPYWREMNRKLQSVTPAYKPMYPSKIYKEMLPMLRRMAESEIKSHLQYRPHVGRTLTGDGATKGGAPLIDFHCYVPGKGVKLMDIIDCTKHMSEGGVKDSL